MTLNPEARKQRERELRRRLLFTIYHWSKNLPNGLMPAKTALIEANGLQDPGEKFGDGVEETAERHALSLIRDLVNAGLIKEQMLKPIKPGQSFGLEHLQVGVTDQGSQLIEETIKPHPLVADDRTFF